MATSLSGRAAHRPSRRDMVVRAGLDEFLAARYMEVSLSSVARRAGMSTSSVYYHFSSKEDLWLELHESVTESLLRTVVNGRNGDGPAADVHSIVAAFVEWMGAEPALALFYSAHVGGNARIEAGRRTNAGRFVAAIADALKPTSDNSPGSGTDVRAWVAAVTTEVACRELCVAQAAGHLEAESLDAAAAQLAQRIVNIDAGQRNSED